MIAGQMFICLPIEKKRQIEVNQANDLADTKEPGTSNTRSVQDKVLRFLRPAASHPSYNLHRLGLGPPGKLMGFLDGEVACVIRATEQS